MLFDIISQWKCPSDELRLSFKDTIEGYQSLFSPEQWNQLSVHLQSSPL